MCVADVCVVCDVCVCVCSDVCVNDHQLKK